ncbi:MAG TPA: SPFH domain-containing protein [Ktedonobacteraceae bacterium]|nr:SPFH domain-containing protein [Ktedonobacteraceae bacterium]
MSSDGKDPGAIWQGPSKPDWGQSEQQAQMDQQLEFADLSQQQADAPHVFSLIDDDLADEALPPDANWQERLKRYARQAMPVWLPLLLGVLTSIFVIPFIIQGRASISLDNLWLIVTVIVVVTLSQMAALFYTSTATSQDDAGTGNILRIPAIVGGILLFVLSGVFALAGSTVGLITLVIVIALFVVLFRLYVHPVPEGFVDIVYTLGKYSRTLYAGPNVLLPWEKVAHHLKVSSIQWLCPLQRVQLSRAEDVLLRATISYRLLPRDAYLAVTRVDRWEEGLRELFITCVQTIATAFAPEDFISWPEGLHTPPSVNENVDSVVRRDRINNYLYNQMSDKAALWGIIVQGVGVRDIMLAPHDAVIDAETLFASPDPPAAPQPQSQMANTRPPAEPAATTLPEKNLSGAGAPKTNNVPKASENAMVVESSARAMPQQPGIVNEEILSKAYKEVQNGRITDPQTIREIAARFQAIADDPQASQKVNFDAERGAANLQEQARKYEESASKQRK